MSTSDSRPVSFLPAPPDLAGRLPPLDQAALNQGADLLPLDEARARFWALGRFLAAFFLWPYACWRVAGAGWLLAADAAILAAVGLVLSAVGVAWHLVAFRSEQRREWLRARRAALENELLREGYGALFAGYGRAVDRAYGRSAPGKPRLVSINYDQFREQLTGLVNSVNEITARLGSSVVVSPGQADQGGQMGTVALPLASGLDYWDTPLELLIQRLVRGQPYSLRALAQGDARYCTPEEYRLAMGRLAGAGLFVQVQGKAAQPCRELAGLAERWAAAPGLGEQMNIEEEAHVLAVARLGGDGERARFPSPVAGVQ